MFNMAAANTTKLDILTPEQRKNLEALSASFDKADKTLSLLEELGLGVGDMKARLEWAKKRRDILLAKG